MSVNPYGGAARRRGLPASLVSAAAVALAALAALAVVSHHLIGDSDPFWAYATGAWIAAHRAVPFVDPFSWTARGVPWVAHEWLFDLVLYVLARHLGYYGLLLLVFPGLAGFAACLWLLCRSAANRAVASTVFVLALLLPLVSFTARPQVFSFFFFALFLYVLHFGSDTRVRWLLPAVMVVWANVHASAPLGVVMTAFAALLESRLLRRHGLWGVAGATLAASLVNPRGVGLWRYAVWMAGQNHWLHFVGEWQQPDFTSAHHALLWIFLFCLFTAVAAFVGAQKEDGRRPAARSWALTLYLAGFIFLFLSASRYYAYFVTVWAAFVCHFLPAGVFTRVRRLPVHAAQAVLLAAVAVALGWPLPGPSLAAAAREAGMPVRAVDFLQARHRTGHLFNAYDWGGYLIYRGVPPFIDGRIGIFAGTGVVRDYVAAVELHANPEKVFDKYGVQTLLLPKRSPLSVFAGQSAAWAVAYRGKKSIVFVRKTAVSSH